MITLHLEDKVIEDIKLALHNYINILREEKDGVDEIDIDFLKRIEDCETILIENLYC